MNKRLTLIFLSLIFGFGVANAQSMKAYVGAASEAVANKDYGSALYYYRIIVEEAETSDIQQVFNAAETARIYRSYEFAENWYTKVLESEVKAEYPSAWYGLGVVRKSLGKYELAKEAFTSYLSLNPNGNHAGAAQKNIEDCDAALAMEIDMADSSIIHLDERVNTTYSEVSALRVGEELYYSSLRFDSKAEEPVYCCAFGKTLASKGELEGQLLEGNFNDTTKHTINGRFDSNQKRIYYNTCMNINATEVRCEIFYREKNDDGSWGSSVRLSDQVNLAGYTATQPSVGMNKENGKTYLFFASDRPEGKGGMDIWCSVMEDSGDFSTPFNVDILNTEGDDITPFYHAASNRIFFSSDGRQNMGGFDIYYSNYEADAWGAVGALDYPVNTSYDEAFYSLSAGLDTPKGYFSSNRPGTFYKDSLYKYSCNDIFSYDIRIDLHVLTYNAVDSTTEWDSCTVRLINLTTGEVQPLTNYDGNDFDYLNLKSDQEFLIIADREGYISDTMEYNTLGVFNTRQDTVPLYLRPKIDLQVFTYAFDAVDTTVLAGCKVQLFDITTGSVLVDSLPPLTSNIEYNEFLYKYLFIGHRYRITATKEDYTQAVTLVSLQGDLSEYLRPRTITRNLYLKCELCEFELLQIYFNNDEPGPHTRYDLTTREQYDSTYYDYYAEKDHFVSQFAEGDPEREKIAQFFEGNVRGGWERLQQFAEILVKYMTKEEVRITVLIEGYASPLSNPVYNNALTNRRVKSVEGYFKSYSPVLKAAIERGDLKLTLEGFGDTKAKGGTNNRKDTIGSIYNEAASKERRVEIKKFRIIRDVN